MLMVDSPHLEPHCILQVDLLGLPPSCLTPLTGQHYSLHALGSLYNLDTGENWQRLKIQPWRKVSASIQKRGRPPVGSCMGV